MHGANRLGGNGVANSTVFGAIAGDAMAAWVAREGVVSRCRRSARSRRRSNAPNARFMPDEASDLEEIRERLHTTMWDDAGIVRDAASLAPRRRQRSMCSRGSFAATRCRARRATRAFNMTWHDWLNLGNLVSVSEAIVRSADGARELARRAFQGGFPRARRAVGLQRLPACESGRMLLRSTRFRCASRAFSPGASLLTT